MTGILHALDQRRLIDSNGIADGSSIAFYATGTLTPATIYSDAALTTPRTNPVVVGAGAAVPEIYLDPDTTYRRVITYSDGSTDDSDPYTSPWATRAEIEEVGFIRAENYGAVGNGTTDDSGAIMDALAVGNVRLRAGITYGVAAPVLIPSNRSLHLNGATLKMLSSFATVDTINAVVGANAKANVAVYGPGTINGNKVANGTGDAFRKNGVMFKDCTNVITRGFNVKNCYGYAIYPVRCSLVESSFHRIENCQYHLEQMGCTDVLVSDCILSNGDGDVTCSGWLHPVFADANPCKRIRFRRIYAYGLTATGVSCQNGSAAAAAQRDIDFEDCHIELTGGGTAFVLQGANGHENVTARRCVFKCAGAEAVNVSLLDGGRFQNCTIDAGQSPFVFLDAEAVLEDCTVIAAGGASDAFGVSNVDNATASRIEIVRGTITVTGSAGLAPVGGTYIYLSRETVLTGFSTDGFRVISAANVYNPKAYDQNRTFDLTWTANNQDIQLLADSSMQLPAGTKFWVRASSTGTKTISASGATLKPVTGTASLATIAANGTALVEKSTAAADTWFVSGDLV